MYVYILFDLIFYEVWWGKLDKREFFRIFSSLSGHTSQLSFKIMKKWWHSESSLSCEEIVIWSFDQIEQKLPYLLFVESNSRVIIFIYIFWTFISNIFKIFEGYRLLIVKYVSFRLDLPPEFGKKTQIFVDFWKSCKREIHTFCDKQLRSMKTI